MISPTALIPQGSSAMVHFSLLSTAPADKRAVLLCQECKIQVQRQGKRKMSLKLHYLVVFFAQLEKLNKGENLNFS